MLSLDYTVIIYYTVWNNQDNITEEVWQYISKNEICFIKFNQLIVATNPNKWNWDFPDIWHCSEDWECSRSSCNRFMNLRNLAQDGAN